MMPRITDDDGNVVAAADIGPPPLFPVRAFVKLRCLSYCTPHLPQLLQNVELPPTLEQEPLDQRLVQRWRELSMSYRRSPYHLKPAAPKGDLSWCSRLNIHWSMAQARMPSHALSPFSGHH